VKAISLWQLWAHLIAIGAKAYETRSWSTPYRGLMAIHAAKHWTSHMLAQCYTEPFRTILARSGTRFPVRWEWCDTPDLWIPPWGFGVVVAVADLVDVRPTHEVLPQLGPNEVAFGDFSHDRFAWEYRDVTRLTEAVPCPGRQGLFTLPTEIAKQVEEAIHAASCPQ